LKKVFYIFLKFFVILVVAIVILANSSFVIEKIANSFAPNYHISYSSINGNILTGIKIDNLKFKNKTLSSQIKFSWNPAKLLYKRVAINEFSVHNLNVEVLKEVIAYFSTDDNSNSSNNSPLPVVILVSKIHLDIEPFQEEGITFSKTELDLSDIEYNSEELSVDELLANIQTDVSKIELKASLYKQKLTLKNILLKDINTVKLEEIFLKEDENSTTKEESKASEEDEELNTFIPREIELKKLLVTTKERDYKNIKLNKVELTLGGLFVDVLKILNNKKSAIEIEKYKLKVDSNVSKILINGDLRDSIVTLNKVLLDSVNVQAIENFIVNDNNTLSDDANTTKENNETNNLIPQRVLINSLNLNILPFKYEPVSISVANVDVEDLKFDIVNLLFEDANLSIDIETNLAKITHNGKVKNNILIGDILLKLEDALYTKYNLPIRKKAIEELLINLNVNKNRAIATIDTKAKNLLKVDDTNTTDLNTTKAFNVDIDSLKSKVIYSIDKNILRADSKIMLSTPYAKDINITNLFLMDNNISYKGLINAKKIIGFDENITNLLNNFLIEYRGSLNNIDADISTNSLKGKFVSKDLKKGNLTLSTKNDLLLNNIFALPEDLNKTKISINSVVPIDFNKTMPINAKINLKSNVVNFDANIEYDNILILDLDSNIPSNSLLKEFNKNVKWNRLTPFSIKLFVDENISKLNIDSKVLNTYIKYIYDNKTLQGKVNLSGLTSKIDGNIEDIITIKTNVNSIESLTKSLKSIYQIDNMPKVEGKLNLSAEIVKLKELNLNFSSPNIVYNTDRTTSMNFSDVKFVVSADKSKVQLKSYSINYDDMIFFSTKPSVVNMSNDNIKISELWLNDQLKIIGDYNLTTLKGKVISKANKFHFKHEIVDLDSSINIDTYIDNNNTDINGSISILGGDIHYDLSGKTSYSQDSDIVIVQDMKSETESPFMNGLSLLLNINTKEPLIYKKGPIDIEIDTNLGIHKSKNSDMMFLGSVTLLEGGSYIFYDKKFVLQKSNIYFTGEIDKPLLDIKVDYKHINYLITIHVSGTATSPNIFFSSIPSLTKEQILSIILFDSDVGAGTNSGDDMMKMMGGAMAKSVLSNIGVKIDHLVIGSNGSVEVGKKITDKIMFIYVDGKLPKVKVKYMHTDHLESILSADAESKSYDITYKRDFSDDDMIIFK